MSMNWYLTDFNLIILSYLQASQVFFCLYHLAIFSQIFYLFAIDGA